MRFGGGALHVADPATAETGEVVMLAQVAQAHPGSRRRTIWCTHSAVGCGSVARTTSSTTRRGPVSRSPRARTALSAPSKE